MNIKKIFKTTIIVGLSIILLLCIFIGYYNKIMSLINYNKSINYDTWQDNSTKFSTFEINDAIKTVENHLHENWYTCYINQIWYDDETSNNMLDIKDNDNRIVLFSNLTEYNDLNKIEYSNFKWYLEYDKSSSTWKVVSFGYA